MMGLKQRMKLYEATHQKQKLVLNECLFEAYYDDMVSVTKDALGKLERVYNSLNSMLKNKDYGIDGYQYYKKHFNSVIEYLRKFIKEYPVPGINEDVIPEEDPVITEPVSNDHVTPEVTATPEQAGIQSMLQDLIKDEWDAINGYSGTIQTLKGMGGYDDLCGVLQEISNEELIHIGQLQKALEFVNPVTAKIKEGEEEATEQMTEPSTLPEEIGNFAW